jgi:hypothetical protein
MAVSLVLRLVAHFAAGAIRLPPVAGRAFYFHPLAVDLKRALLSPFRSGPLMFIPGHEPHPQPPGVSGSRP